MLLRSGGKVEGEEEGEFREKHWKEESNTSPKKEELNLASQRWSHNDQLGQTDK